MNREEELERMRHSATHLMAEAVQSLFVGVKFGIGPAIEDGFYYDFELPRPLTPEDLPAIENRMKEIIDADYPFIREEVGKEEACRLFADQPYKLELIDEFPDDRVSIYKQGSFTDLCRGPHVASTSQIKAFKLTHIAGAYWRGDEKRPMLQRIYGVAFDSQAELEDYLGRQAEAMKRDHRKLGRELDIFRIHEEIGPGLVCWHPRGALIRQIIEDFWKAEHAKRGYDVVYTPHIAKLDLWKTSGHWDFYRDYLYSPIEVEGQQYILRPMNCLGHILIYKSQLRSYRDLPLRYAEMSTFGFSHYELLLSTRPERYVGAIQMWDEATRSLANVMENLGLPYDIDPGEGVFYGPKIDIKLRDALGHAWQGPTIQVDFNLPERFDVCYIGDDGAEHPVVMIHRTVLGSMERFVACLIEHYGGVFPVWLSPVQAIIIPVADRHIGYAQQIQKELEADGVRSRVDERTERMNLKIREAQLQKIPYMLVVGDKEVASSNVSFRLRSGGNIGTRSLPEVKELVKAAIEARC